MTKANKTPILTTGLAMFAMFFGAGNVVFPLALGHIAQDKNFYAILGMLITAVGVPFTGLIAMTLFDGDYKPFFARIGIIPGFIVSLIIMGLIGPFGAMPRCIALSYSTTKAFLPGVSLPLFSALSCVTIWLFTFKRNSIVDTLGYLLTPLLIGSLGIIIIKGVLMSSPELPPTPHEHWAIFLRGLLDGYLTMDLLGAFFFSSVVIACLRNNSTQGITDHKQLVITTLKASIIGASLLACAYVGFSYVASFHSEVFTNATPDELISLVAVHVLGKHAALVACVAVALACLTTAIALASVFAEFIQDDITNGKVKYGPALLITLFFTFFVSTLNFTGIAAFLFPILQVCYPALIVLSILNILYKLYDFKPVKIPVFIVFLISLAAFYW